VLGIHQAAIGAGEDFLPTQAIADDEHDVARLALPGHRSDRKRKHCASRQKDETRSDNLVHGFSPLRRLYLSLMTPPAPGTLSQAELQGARIRWQL
jgi:hypothetical protein